MVLEFVRSNPAIDAFDNRRRQQRTSRAAQLTEDRGRFALGEAEGAAQRRNTENRVLSEVVGGAGRGAARPAAGVPRPGGAGASTAPARRPAAPAPSLRDRGATALAGAGLGSRAFELGAKAEDTRAATARRGAERSDAMFDAMARALGEDRPEAALIIARQAGMKITPTMQGAFNNAFFRREFKRRFDLNKQSFKDPRQFERQMQRDTVELLGRIASNRGGVPQASGGPPREVPTGDPATVGQPFQDRQGKLFVRRKDGTTAPVLGPDKKQLTGRPRGRDPFIVSPTQRLNAINKQFEILKQNDFFSEDPRSDEELRADAAAAVDRELRRGGARNVEPRSDQAAPFQPSGGPADAPLAPGINPLSPQGESQRFFGDLGSSPRVDINPLPTDARGGVDQTQLRPGLTYQTRLGPLRYTGIPGREWQRVN